MGPAPFAGLQPAQIGLEPQCNALEQQGGVGVIRFAHRGPLRGWGTAVVFAAGVAAVMARGARDQGAGDGGVG